LSKYFLNINFSYQFFKKLLVFLFSKWLQELPYTPLSCAKAQDLGVAADVCIKSQHIHAPLWQVWVHVHGEAQ
jgi:hypothetical protein